MPWAVQNCGAAAWKNMVHCGAAAAAGGAGVAVVATASASSMAVAPPSVAISRLNGVVRSTCASSWKNMPHCGTACFCGDMAAVVDMDAVAPAVVAEACWSARPSRVAVCEASRWTDRALVLAGPLRSGVHAAANGDGAATEANPRCVATFKIGVHDCALAGAVPPHGGSSTGRAALKAARTVVVAAERDIFSRIQTEAMWTKSGGERG